MRATLFIRAAPAALLLILLDAGRPSFAELADDHVRPGDEEWDNQGIAWSRDGKRLAYKIVRKDKELVVLYENGIAREGKSYDEVRDLLFSPDGRILVYVAKKGERETLVVDGKEGPEYSCINLWSRTVFSPDGRHMAYAACKASRNFVVFDGKEGDFEIDVFKQPVFSSDGRSFAYVAEHTSTNGLRGKSFVVLNNQPQKDYDGILNHPLFRPNSSELVYVAEQADMRFLVVGSEQGEGHKNVYYPVFSRDGRTMAHLDEGDSTTLVVNEQRYPHLSTAVENLTVSPDGSRIAYSAGGRLVLAGQGMKQYSGGEVSDLLFSRDGKRLAYVVRDTRNELKKDFVVVDGVEGKRYQEIGSLLFDSEAKPVYVATRASKGGATSCVVRNGEEGPWYDGVAHLVASADGKRIAYCAARREKVRMVVDRREEKTYDDVSAPVFSTSGQVAYTARLGGEQFVVKDGQEMKRYDEIHYLRFGSNGQDFFYVGSVKRAMYLVVNGHELGPYEGIGELGTPQKYRENEKHFRARAGDVTLFEQHPRGDLHYYLQLNDKTIFDSSDMTDVCHQTELRGEDLILVREHAGDGCPAIYQLVAISPGGETHISESFGNCGDPEIIQSKSALIMKFALDREARRAAGTWIYKNKRLEAR